MSTNRMTRPVKAFKERSRVSSLAVLATAGLLLATCGTATRSDAESLSRAPSAPPFTQAEKTIWGSTWSYNVFSPDFLGDADYFSLLPLALPSSLTTFIPKLALSWKVVNGALEVNLRHGATWQDGRPFTSTDVVDSFLLDGIASNGVWNDITSVSARGRYSVVFDLYHGVSIPNAEYAVLGTMIAPIQSYRGLVTKGLEGRLQTYYRIARINPTEASSSPAGKLIASDDSRLLKLTPPSLIGDGPFRLVAVNTSEAKFVKWPQFYGARKVHVQQYIVQQSLTYPEELITGEVDYSTGAPTWALAKKMLQSGDRIIPADNYAGYAIYFNDRKYPLDMVKVRQAIAYIIHRPDINALSNGGGTFDKYLKYPMIVNGSAMEHGYLTQSQISSLNSYAYNPTKAAALLREAGFHKVQGRWIMPNGKPFTLTYDAPAGWTDPVGLTSVIPEWLTAFGIKTTGTAVEQPGYWTYQQQGDFDLDWGWSGTNGTGDPLTEINGLLGHALNFSTSGTYKGDPGIGFGPRLDVPGLGATNIPNALNTEANTIPPGPKMKKLVWDWERLVNEQLPALPYGYKEVPIQISTQHYTDWPKKTSPLWSLIGFNENGGLAQVMEDGYVRPVR